MSVNSRKEALRILGLPSDASREDIRDSYHRLVKMYHPDVTNDEDSAQLLYAICEAYDYLSNEEEEAPVAAENVRILGSAADLSAASERRHAHAVYRRQQKKYEKLRDAKKEETEKWLKEASEDFEYEKAMERIHAIRAAEVTAQIIEAVLYGERHSDNPKGV